VWESYPEVGAVRDLAFDTDGNLWAVGYKGAALLDLSEGEMNGYTKKDGLPTNDIMAVAVGPEEKVWFGTRRAGACCYDGSNWTTFTEADGLLSDTIMAVAIDAEGTLAFGSAKGVTVFTP